MQTDYFNFHTQFHHGRHRSCGDPVEGRGNFDKVYPHNPGLVEAMECRQLDRIDRSFAIGLDGESAPAAGLGPA